MDTDVSVVVPSYNHIDYIEMCIRSIIKQTRRPRELIVIDDGSTDGSPAVIERALEDCPFSCEFIVQSNRGLCATLNEALDRSRGRYFAYLGSDDLWLPDFLCERVGFLAMRPDAVFAYGNSYTIDADNRIIGDSCSTAMEGYSRGDLRARFLCMQAGPISTTVVYKRDVLLRHRWREGARLEDYEMRLRLLTEGDFAFDPRIFSAWRRHGYNTSGHIEVMLDERLEAQGLVGKLVGLPADDLKLMQRATTYCAAGGLLLKGLRWKALRMSVENLHGARSGVAILRRLVGIALPTSVIAWLERRSALDPNRYNCRICENCLCVKPGRPRAEFALRVCTCN